MNRDRGRAWVHWAALCVAVLAILAVWGLWPAEPPWLIVTGLGGALGGLLVVETRHRRAPVRRGPVEDLGPVEGATVEEFLAAVDARYGTGGLSGAATPHKVLWNGETLPPFLPPVMATAPYPAHDHEVRPGATGRLGCPACTYTLDLLARLGAAQAEGGERLADTALAAYAARLNADMDTQVREYLAHLTADMHAAREELAAPMTGPVCAAEFGQHLCGRRGSHDSHRCECGTVWGMTG